MFGFPGQTYRVGLLWIISVPFMILIVTFYLSFAPRLYVLSKKYGYITPTDYFADRFDSDLLRLLVSTLYVFTLIPYLILQLTAMGHAFVGITSGRFPFEFGVIFISAVMLAFILLGGFRAVLYNDLWQGILLTGLMLMATWIFLEKSGGLGAVIQQAVALAPEKVAVPDSVQVLTRDYLSLIVLAAIGAAMYPQAIQRIYAAKSEKTLKSSLSLLVLAPFLTALCAVLIGMCGIVTFPHLGRIEADEITGHLIGTITQEYYWLAILLFAAAIGAVMSTADSVLLTMASVFTKDIYKPFIRTEASNTELAKVGRLFTVVILLSAGLFSLHPFTTLWNLSQIKFEFLIQLYPPLMFGLYWRRFSRIAALSGLMTGVATAGILMLLGFHKFGYTQAGIYGFALNIITCLTVGKLCRPRQEESLRTQSRFFQVFQHGGS